MRVSAYGARPASRGKRLASRRHRAACLSPLPDEAGHPRGGAGTLDYVLILGAILPIAGVSFYLGTRIVRLAYEMILVLVAWPFM